MTKPIEIEICKASVLGSSMAYREAGAHRDAPVPCSCTAIRRRRISGATSCRLYRRSHIASRPISSASASPASPTSRYRFVDHVRYLDAFIEQRGIKSAISLRRTGARRSRFILRRAGRISCAALPSWSSSARCRPGRTFTTPRSRRSRTTPRRRRAAFRKFRTPGEGEAMILEANAFVERVLPVASSASSATTRWRAYRAPFPTPESRRPVLAFPRELPIAGEPADVYETLQSAHAALAASSYPKLLFSGEPGALVSPEFAERFAASLNHCALVRLGPGLHFLQEDHPEAIAAPSPAGSPASRPCASSVRPRAGEKAM